MPMYRSNKKHWKKRNRTSRILEHDDEPSRRPQQAQESTNRRIATTAATNEAMEHDDDDVTIAETEIRSSIMSSCATADKHHVQECQSILLLQNQSQAHREMEGSNEHSDDFRGLYESGEEGGGKVEMFLQHHEHSSSSKHTREDPHYEDVDLEHGSSAIMSSRQSHVSLSSIENNHQDREAPSRISRINNNVTKILAVGDETESNACPRQRTLCLIGTSTLVLLLIAIGFIVGVALF